ncbi:uncharacterized protein NPIL_512161 [Nephila pilipes]|uniref:Tudor domain-containing protein 1 n=1 Tax=Nephila pilipes TaxID=299642 RepID=A0A8X6UHC1_NEPPI|nr:uncharacterized protein NPIL_512161 [Nephila pilipes]
MPAFQHKTIVISCKLRIKNKFKSISEETENVITLLQSSVSALNDKVNELLGNNDENFLPLYEKLNNDFEKYQEKLFFVLASFENPDVEDINNQVLRKETNRSCVPLENCSQISNPFLSETTSSQTCLKTATPSKTSSVSSSSYCSLQDICDAVSPTSHKECNIVNTDHGSSIWSTKNAKNIECEVLQSSQFQQSTQSLSQNSCYHSLSSNISVIKDVTNSSNFETVDHDKLDCSTQNLNCKTFKVKSRPTTVILPSSISVPSVISATLTHVVNPHDFWMQLENSNGCALTFPSSQVIQTDPPSCVQCGDYCLAPFKSIPFYYRAKIMTEISEQHRVEVFFIDHGLSQSISIWDLRSLPEELYKIPMQAVHCCLFEITPVDGTWTQSSIEKLKEFQNNTLETHVKSLKCCTNGYIYAVQLIATLSAHFNEDFSCDIAQALCLDGLANMNEMSHFVQESISSEISNQRSCDSGVSVTSNQRASPCIQSLSDSSDVLNICSVSSEPLNTSQNKPYIETGAVPKAIVHKGKEVPDLISFDSVDKMCAAEKNTKLTHLIGKCLQTVECNCELHLEIPPPSVTFVEKDMMLVMLSHIVNPNEFYVNLAMDNSIALDELRDQMSSVYESVEQNFHVLSLQDLKEGMYLAAHFDQDGNWYRVRILRINSESERTCDVYVQYIDYGNKAFVKYCDLRPLLPEFAEHPSFSIKCSLTGVTPKGQDVDNSRNSNADPEPWCDEAIKKFRELISFERCLTAQICESRKSRVAPKSSFESKPLEVLLWDTEGTEDVLINEVFCESNLCEFHNNVLKIVEQNAQEEEIEAEYLNHWDPQRDEFANAENSYGVHKEDPEVALSGYKNSDGTYVCKYYSLRGYCPRSDCPYAHLQLVDGGITHDQEETYALDSVPSLPSPFSFVLVQVSAVINPGLFYCVLPYGNKTVDEVDSLVNQGLANQMWMKDEVKILFENMRKFYSSTPFTENTTVAVSYGSIVVAWRRVDCSWHRGRVLDVSDVTGPAKIFFVDFGDEDWVPRIKIRKILPEYLHTPFQAVECHLSDVVPLGFENGEKWSPDAVYHFKQLVAYEILLAHVAYRCGKILHLTLRKTSENDHQTISENLVKHGFAEYMLSPASNGKESIYVPG